MSHKLEKLLFKLEKIIGIEKHAEKVRKVRMLQYKYLNPLCYACGRKRFKCI
jgi:hypothetical protein